MSWQWQLGDQLEWTHARIKHRGTIIAFEEPNGPRVRTEPKDPIYFGGNARVPWAEVRRPKTKRRAA